MKFADKAGNWYLANSIDALRLKYGVLHFWPMALMQYKGATQQQSNQGGNDDNKKIK